MKNGNNLFPLGIVCLGLVLFIGIWALNYKTVSPTANTAASDDSTAVSDNTREIEVNPPEVIANYDIPKQDIMVSYKVVDPKEEDPRSVYSKYLKSMLQLVEEDPSKLPCTPEMQAMIAARPEIILDAQKTNPAFIYSIASVEGATEYFVRVSYYQGEELRGDVVTFVNDNGAISLKNPDELFVLLSRGEFVE